jgi:hypothetical protein
LVKVLDDALDWLGIEKLEIVGRCQRGHELFGFSLPIVQFWQVN